MEESFNKNSNASGTNTRKNRGKSMSLVEAIDREYREIVPKALKSDRRTAKVIALFAGATPRAVENWRDGLNGPQVPHFIALAREIPELKAKVLEWLDASTGDSGDDPSRVLDEIGRLLQAREKP